MTKGKRETEMEVALVDAAGLLGADAFEAAVTLMGQSEDPDLSDEDREDCRAAARLAREYAREQIEVDIADGEMGDESPS